MKKYGLVVADEREAVFNYFREVKNLEFKDFEVYLYEGSAYSVYVLFCGPGEVQAASGTQHLIDKYGVEAIFNLGVVGGIDEELKTGDVVVVSSVVPYQYDLSPLGYEVATLPDHLQDYITPTDNELFNVIDELRFSKGLQVSFAKCASGDKFLEAEEKALVQEKFGAQICDMESYGIIYTSNLNNVPCFLIKAVSDSSNDGAEMYRKMLKSASMRCADILAQMIYYYHFHNFVYSFWDDK